MRERVTRGEVWHAATAIQLLPPSRRSIRLDYRPTSEVCLVTLSALHGYFVVVDVVSGAIVDGDDQQKTEAASRPRWLAGRPLSS